MNEQFYGPCIPPEPATRPAKPLFAKSGADSIAVIALVILSILAVSSIFWNRLMLGYTIVYDISLVAIFLFLYKKGGKINLPFIICGVLSIISSLSFFLTSNAAIRILLFLYSIFSAIVLFAAAAGKEYKKSDYSLITYFLTATFKSLDDLPRVFKSLFSKNPNRSKSVSNALIGMLCAIPAALVIIPLLANADDAFYALITGIVGDYVALFQKIILGIGASVFAITIVFSLKYGYEQSSEKKAYKKINNITVSAFLSVICVIYLIYLVSQLAYFFSAFASILPQGYKFTYADYARRGFFELCVISVINLILIYAAILFSNKSEGKISKAIKIPAAFVIGFNFIIIFTAISKMVMYINAYGCSVLRIFTVAFMIWMLILFICLLIRIFVKRLDVPVCGLISGLIILSVLGIGNVNAQIAKYNYNAYLSGKQEIDVEYMARLGDEGIPYLYELTKNEDPEISDAAKAQLYYLYYDYYEFYDWDWMGDVKDYNDFSKLKRTWSGLGAYGIPKAKAYEILDKYAKEQNGRIYFEYKDYDYIDDDYDDYDDNDDYDDYYDNDDYVFPPDTY